VPTIQKFITRIDKLNTESKGDQIRFGKADLEAGKLKYERDSVRIYEGNNKFDKYSIFCDLKDFRKYGPGIYLFFDWMKQMIYLLFILTIFSAIAMYFNYKGLRLRDVEVSNPLDKMMLANNALDVEKEGLTIGDVINWDDVFSTKSPRTKTLLADYISTVVMFLYIFIYNWRLKKLVHEAKQECTSISSYAVEVSNIPPTTTAASIGALMNKFGKTAEITIGRNYLGVFEKYNSIKDLEVKLRYDYGLMKLKGLDNSLQSEMMNFKERIIKKKRDLYNQLIEKGANIAKHDDFPAWNAYVIFENLEAKASLLTRANAAERRTNLRKIFCCLEKKTFIEYNGKPLHFKSCDEPTNIKYENVCKSTKHKLLNRLLTALMILTVIVIDFIVIYFINRISLPTRNDKCIISPTYEEMEANPQATSNYDLQYCYCRTQSYATLLDNNNYKYCHTFALSTSTALIVSIGSSIIIMISNSILRAIINKFSAKMLFNKVTTEMSVVTYIIFFSELLNFIVITILLRGSFMGFKPSVWMSSLLGSIHPSLTDNNPIYNDYTTSWYLDIGTKIQNELMIETMVPHIFALVTMPIVKKIRFSRANASKMQFDVTANMRSSRFDIPPKAAHVLCQFFVCVFLSSGIPILVPFALIFMVLYYWINKKIFINYSKNPFQIDESFAISTGRLMYLAVLLHCYMGFFMYRADGVISMPSSINPLNGTKVETGVAIIDNNIRDQLVFVGVGALSAAMLVWYFVLTPLVNTFGLFSLCCGKNEEDDALIGTKSSEPSIRNPTKPFSEEKKKLHMVGCASYNILSNPDYHDIIISMDLGNTSAKPMQPMPGQRPPNFPPNQFQPRPANNQVMPMNRPGGQMQPPRTLTPPPPRPMQSNSQRQMPNRLAPGGPRPMGGNPLLSPNSNGSPARLLPSSARNMPPQGQPSPFAPPSNRPMQQPPRPFGVVPLPNIRQPNTQAPRPGPQPGAPRPPFGSAPMRSPMN